MGAGGFVVIKLKGNNLISIIFGALIILTVIGALVNIAKSIDHHNPSDTFGAKCELHGRVRCPICDYYDRENV